MPPRAASPRAGRFDARPSRSGVGRRRAPGHRRAVLSLIAVAVACACTRAPAQSLASMPERKARHAQREFEMLRRALLPRVPARGDGCDVTIGDICYWDDNADSPLPVE